MGTSVSLCIVTQALIYSYSETPPRMYTFIQQIIDLTGASEFDVSISRHEENQRVADIKLTTTRHICHWAVENELAG